MKQFNLEEYLANPSMKIVTREGKPVRIICTDAKFEKYQVLALIDGYDSHLDLFFAPEKHEGWINLYKSGNGWSLGANIWQTEEEAKKWVGAADYATTIKIEWEE